MLGPKHESGSHQEWTPRGEEEQLFVLGPQEAVSKRGEGLEEKARNALIRECD